jgi:hypothetical protein
MRKVLLLCAAITVAAPLPAQEEESAWSPEVRREFLMRHLDALAPIERAYDEADSARLPVRDEFGRSLRRRGAEDHRHPVEQLRDALERLQGRPDDLTFATRMLIATDALLDDLSNLSEIAYDDDQEELGRRLGDLARVVERHWAEVEAYVLYLAAEKELRLEELERENLLLRETLEKQRAQP